MARNSRALVGPLLAIAALTGCSETYDQPEPRFATGPSIVLRGAAMRTIGAPGAPDLPFGEALVTYSRMVGAVHAFTGARADPQLHAAVLQLATILDRMPAAGAQPALRRAAALIRAQQGAIEPEETDIAATRRSLTFAATALLDLAMDAYRGSPDITARARTFAGAVEAIDVERKPPDRATLIDALVRAERVLAAMYAANVRSPNLPAAPPAAPP